MPSTKTTRIMIKNVEIEEPCRILAVTGNRFNRLQGAQARYYKKNSKTSLISY